MLRFVGRNDVAAAHPWIDEWAPKVADWITRGLTPYVFLHTPHDQHAPELAKSFHEALTRHLSQLPALPLWAGNHASAVPRQRQRELF